MAHRKLGGVSRAAADEEDVAVMAFTSFFQAVQKGRFPDLHDRHDLWQLLFMLTERRAFDVMRKELAAKHAHGQVLNEGALGTGDSASGTRPFDALIGQGPSPEFAAEVAEEFRRILARLQKPRLQRVARLKMEGYTIAEIAAQLQCATRTVDRQLGLIRQILEDELED